MSLVKHRPMAVVLSLLAVGCSGGASQGEGGAGHGGWTAAGGRASGGAAGSASGGSADSSSGGVVGGGGAAGSAGAGTAGEAGAGAAGAASGGGGSGRVGGAGGAGGQAMGGAGTAVGGHGGAQSTLSFASAVRYPGGSWDMMIQAGDVNGDGKIDVVAADFSSPDASAEVYLNKGDGTFGLPAKYITGTGTGSISLGDFSGDGRLDLVVSNNGSPYVTMLINGGDGTFGAPTNFPLNGSIAVLAGDFSGDGKTDFFAQGDTSPLFLNQGSGSFSPPIMLGGGGFSLAAADLDGDGKLDLVGGGSRIIVLINKDGGTFNAAKSYATGSQTTGSIAHGIAIGDLNGDGRPDVAAANDDDGTVSVLFNEGDGTLGPARVYQSGPFPTSVQIGDLNGDGWPELVVANSALSGVHAERGTVAVFVNKGDGTFVAPMKYLAVFPESIALADLNGDGRLDIAVGDGTLEVLINTTP